MAPTKGVPKALFELPAKIVPGLLLLAVAEYASGGTLWASLLQRVSVGLLDGTNVWAFAVTMGLVVALFFGQLLDALARVVEAAGDRLLRRPRGSDAFDWLQVHEQDAAEVVEDERRRYRLLNSFSVSFAACCAVCVAARPGPWLPAAFVIGALACAWRGAAARTAFLDKATSLREAAEVAPTEQH